MAKFEWFNEGKEFRPKIEFDDLDGYQDSQDEWFAAAKKGDKQKVTALLRDQAEFVKAVLKRSVPNAKDAEMGAVEIREAFQLLWELVFPSPKAKDDDGGSGESPLD